MSDLAGRKTDNDNTPTGDTNEEGVDDQVIELREEHEVDPRQASSAGDHLFGMKAHPAALVWPLMKEHELQALAEDIRENDLRKPIILFESRVLDGRNRLLACEIAGVEPTFEKYTGDDPWAFVRSANEHRRHMTQGQRAMVMKRWSEGQRSWLEERERLSEAANKKRRKSVALQVRNDNGKFVESDGSPATLPENGKSHEAPHHERSRIAEIAGVASRLVQDAITVDAMDPALGDQVVQGTLSLPKAAKKARKLKKAANLTTDGCGELKGEVRCIVARAVVSDSETKDSLCDLKRQPIRELAHPEGSVLLLFTEPPNLPASLSLLRSRDFKFKHVFPWLKDGRARAGSNKAPTELCLVGVHGEPVVDPESLPSLIVARPAKNGTLPKVFYELIEREVDGIKVEVGHNGRPRNGWSLLPQREARGRSQRKTTEGKTGGQQPAKKRRSRKAQPRATVKEPDGVEPSQDALLTEGIALATELPVDKVSERIADYQDFTAFLSKVSSAAKPPVSDVVYHPGVVASVFRSHKDNAKDAEMFWPRAFAGNGGSNGSPIMTLHSFLWDLAEEQQDKKDVNATSPEQVMSRCMEEWARFQGDDVEGMAAPDQQPDLSIDNESHAGADHLEQGGDGESDGWDPRTPEKQRSIVESGEAAPVDEVDTDGAIDDGHRGDAPAATVQTQAPEGMAPLKVSSIGAENTEILDLTKLPKVDQKTLTEACMCLSYFEPEQRPLIEATLRDPRFLAFHKKVAGSVMHRIGVQLRKGPSVVVQALAWLEDEAGAETFWPAVRSGDSEDHAAVLYFWMGEMGVRLDPEGHAHKNAVTWRHRFAQCRYAWDCWRTGTTLADEFVSDGSVPGWSEGNDR